MMLRILFSLLLLLGSGSTSASAQALSAEQTPPSTVWQQIETPHFLIVFPENLRAEAQRMANTLEHLYAPTAAPLEARPARIPLVLINQTVTANGFVSLEPRRTVWFTTPAFPGTANLIGSGEWLNLLAVHEFRHIAQFEALDQGMIRFFGLLGGESLQDVFSFLSTPAWFWEGDAVGAETVLTRAGRGRQPAFDMHIRALLLEDIRYPYYKAVHRSFRDYYPSHYALGYGLTTYVKRHHGADAWARVLRRTSWLPVWPFWFSMSLRHTTGQGTEATYHAAMDELAALWKAQQDRLTLTPATPVNRRTGETWTNYLHPHVDADGTILAAKHGLATAPRLVRLDPTGQETDLGPLPIGAVFDHLSVAAGQVVWAQEQPHPRFGYVSWSNLGTQTLADGHRKGLTERTHLFVPELSPDGTRMAAVEFLPDRTNALVLLDAETGAAQQRFPEAAWLNGLAWSPDGTQLAYTFNTPDGTGLGLRDLVRDTTEVLIAPAHRTLANPTFGEGYVFYQTTHTGLDNIFAVDVATRQQYQVTSRPVGAFMPDVSPDGTTLAFSDYTVRGYDVVTMPLDPSTWTPLTEAASDPVVYAEPLLRDTTVALLDPANLPDETYPVRPYRQARHLLRFHSWALEPEDDRWTLDLRSTNVLNTLDLVVGGTYDTQERTWGGRIGLAYGRWLPLLTLETGYRQRAPVGRSETWNEVHVDAGFRIPLTYTDGVIFRSAQLATEGSFRFLDGREFTAGDPSFFALNHTLSLFRSQLPATRDVLPRNQQALLADVQYAPFDASFGGKAYGLAAAFLPGLGRHHGLALTLEGEHYLQPDEGPVFASDATPARGYGLGSYERFARASVNYAFPLAYPDWGDSNVFMLKRLVGNLFFDATFAETFETQRIDRLQSAGAELFFDWGFFEWLLPIRTGGRLSYRFEDQQLEPALTFGTIGF